MLRHTLQQKENHFLLEMLENTLRSLILEVWNIILRMYKQENEFEHSFRWKDTSLVSISDAYQLPLSSHRKWYADQLYVSPDALSAKLKKLYGKTANQLISESLIEEAKVCLLNPANSVQDVAEKLCFSDQASFSKFFKRYCGVSPGQLKNKPKPYFKGSLPSLPVPSKRLMTRSAKPASCCE